MKKKERRRKKTMNKNEQRMMVKTKEGSMYKCIKEGIKKVKLV
jgi:hypothetical protein